MNFVLPTNIKIGKIAHDVSESDEYAKPKILIQLKGEKHFIFQLGVKKCYVILLCYVIDL